MLHCVRYVVNSCNDGKWGRWREGGAKSKPTPPWGSPYPRRPLTLTICSLSLLIVHSKGYIHITAPVRQRS